MSFHRPVRFSIAAALIAAGACAFAAEQPAEYPAWLSIPHVAIDVTFHDGARPADAEGLEMERVLSHIAANAAPNDRLRLEALTLATPAARERGLLALAHALVERGTEADLPLLAQLAERPAEATYMAPRCRQDHAHDLFDYRGAAITASIAIRRRVGGGEALRVGQVSPSDAASVMLDWFDDPERRAGYADAYPGQLEPFAEALLAREALGERTLANAVIDRARREDSRATLRLLALEAPIDTARGALLADAGMPRVEGETLAIRVLREGRTDVMPTALGVLNASDGDAFEDVAALLGDKVCGADAAAALLRIDTTRALEVAKERLLSNDEATRRRAVLVLWRSDNDEARAALDAFANGGDDSLRREVRAWLGQ